MNPSSKYTPPYRTELVWEPTQGQLYQQALASYITVTQALVNTVTMSLGQQQSKESPRGRGLQPDIPKTSFKLILREREEKAVRCKE